MTRACSYGKSRFVSGQADVVIMPRSVTKSYAIVVTHGYTGDVTGMLTPDNPGLWSLQQQLVDGGAVVVAHTLDGDSWGNDASVTDLEAIRTAVGTYGCQTSKIVLFGGSMGGAVIWSYLREHGDKCAGAALVAPTTDLNGYYANPDSTLGNPDISTTTQKNSIATAWGVVSPAALPARADPISNASTIAAFNVPVIIYYSDSATNGLGDADDDGNVVITTSSLQTMVSALGAPASLVHVSSTAMHGDQETVAALDNGLVDWLLGKAA